MKPEITKVQKYKGRTIKIIRGVTITPNILAFTIFIDDVKIGIHSVLVVSRAPRYKYTFYLFQGESKTAHYMDNIWNMIFKSVKQVIRKEQPYINIDSFNPNF